MSERYYPGKRVSSKAFGYFPKDPNQGYSWTQHQMEQSASALYYKTSVGKMLVDATVRYTVGKGLTPMSSPESDILGWEKSRIKTFQKQAEAFWRLSTGKNFDYYGKDSFKALQVIAMKMICNDGDVLVHRGFRRLGNGSVVPYLQLISGRLVISPNRSDTKKLIGGVELDANGKEIAYHIATIGENLEDTTLTKKVNRKTQRGRVEFDLVQLGKSEASMVRGIPLLSALREDIFEYNALRKNHLTKSAVQSLFTVFLEREKDAEDTLSFKDTLESSGATEIRDESGESTLTLGPGYIVDLEPGTKAVTTQSSIAGDDFSAYEKSIIGLMASSLGMSYEVAMNAFNASFSASRASLSGAEKNFQIVRQEFAEKVCTPTWEQVIEYGIISGGIECPEWESLTSLEKKALLSVTWTGVTPPQVDPTKEVNSYKLAVEAGFCTREHASRSLYGFDFEEVAERLAEEQKILEEGGLIASDTNATEIEEEVEEYDE